MKGSRAAAVLLLDFVLQQTRSTAARHVHASETSEHYCSHAGHQKRGVGCLLFQQTQAAGAMIEARAAAVLLLGCILQQCAAQLPGMPMPPQCTGALNGPAPRSDLNWPINETKLTQSLQQRDQGKVALMLLLSLAHPLHASPACGGLNCQTDSIYKVSATEPLQ